MKNYTRYNDYYNTSFIPLLKDFKNYKTLDFASEDIQRQFCSNLVVLFETTYLLLKYFLQNNGLFQFKEIDVFREAFQIDFLENGEEWIKLIHFADFYQKEGYSFQLFTEMLNFINTYGYIFDNINKKFEELCNE